MTRPEVATTATGDELKKSAHFVQRCVSCSREYDLSQHVTSCSSCGGMIDFEYDISSVEDSVRNHGEASSIWKKFSGLLPFLRIETVKELPWSDSIPATGPTPLYKSHGLGDFLGLKDLWIKDESKNSARSFKARDTIMTISRFREIGLNEFVLCSTGNTAAAFCHALPFSKTPMKAHIFLPKGTTVDFPVPRENVPLLEHFDETYSQTISHARQYSSEKGIPYEGGFSNPSRREGAKTIAFEIAEASLEPDYYVQSITSGTGACGFFKGSLELRQLGMLSKVPRLLVVQPERCAPIANAFEDKSPELSSEYVVDVPDTFVGTLTNGNPAFSYPHVRNVVLKSGGLVEKVSEAEIGEAVAMFYKLEGLVVDPAAAVALAGLKKTLDSGRVEKDSTILLNVSGGIRR